MSGVRNLVLAAAILGLSAASLGAGSGEEKKLGINVVLNRPVTDAILADLEAYGRVLDVIQEINGVTVCTTLDQLEAIRTLEFVAGANEDGVCAPADAPIVADFSDGADQWSLDAVNVTDFGIGRTVEYDGEGVIIAVIDGGLPANWREYFPAERIDTLHARCFGGGGNEHGTVSEQPEKWEHDTDGHGGMVTSILLGFQYAGEEPGIPAAFNGVAPKATIIPVKVINQNNVGWSSVLARGFIYVADLKSSGALGEAPVVINTSLQGPKTDALLEAAIDYAIASGVKFVSAAANRGETGMRLPGVHPAAISAANAGWVRQLPADDPSEIAWMLRDVPENDASEFYITPDSSRALAGQDLDVSAPGAFVPVTWSDDGKVDYGYFYGTSAACPHVAGIVALMLQKNPTLTQSEIESILEASALPLAPGSTVITSAGLGPGNSPTWSDHSNAFLVNQTVSWGADATGAGLVQADAALAATPSP